MLSIIFFTAIGLWYIYNNYMKILYFLNKLYVIYTDFRQKHITNRYNFVEKIYIPDSDCCVYSYSINNKIYKIVTTDHSLNKEPYDSESIKSKSNKIEINLQSDDKIILAELIDKEGNIITCTDDIKSISGPLGNFYKDTTNELKLKYLNLYLKYTYKNFTYDKLTIMYSDGNEQNLLTLLK